MTPVNRTAATPAATKTVNPAPTTNPVTVPADAGEPSNNGRLHRQRLSFYHPNSAGNGAAMQLEPRLNRSDADRYNCYFMEMAPQKTVAARTSDRMTPASFDWEHKLTVKLDFADICEILTVLEGRTDKVGGQRNGLFHKSGNATTIISLQKADKGGFFLGLSRKGANEESAVRLNMTLTDAEATGLRSIFQTGLFFMTFHSHLFTLPLQA